MCATKASSPYPQIKKMKCPYCGWVRVVPLDEGVGAAAMAGSRSASDETKALAERIRVKLAERRLEAPEAWLDMPGCPHCDRMYQYNVRTNATRP